MRGEYFLCGEQTIQGGRKSGVNGHLHDDFEDFFPCAADMQRGGDMHFQLRGRIAQSG